MTDMAGVPHWRVPRRSHGGWSTLRCPHRAPSGPSWTTTPRRMKPATPCHARTLCNGVTHDELERERRRARIAELWGTAATLVPRFERHSTAPRRRRRHPRKGRRKNMTDEPATVLAIEAHDPAPDGWRGRSIAAGGRRPGSIRWGTSTRGGPRSRTATTTRSRRIPGTTCFEVGDQPGEFFRRLVDDDDEPKPLSPGWPPRRHTSSRPSSGAPCAAGEAAAVPIVNLTCEQVFPSAVTLADGGGEGARCFTRCARSGSRLGPLRVSRSRHLRRSPASRKHKGQSRRARVARSLAWSMIRCNSGVFSRPRPSSTGSNLTESARPGSRRRSRP
jgi:hypothetical protein